MKRWAKLAVGVLLGAALVGTSVAADRAPVPPSPPVLHDGVPALHADAGQPIAQAQQSAPDEASVPASSTRTDLAPVSDQAPTAYTVDWDALDRAVPRKARGYLSGITGEHASNPAQSLQRLWKNGATDGKQAWQRALGNLGRVAALVVLLAAVRGLSSASGGQAETLIGLAGALGCAGLLLHDMSGMLAQCREALGQMSAFSAVLQPMVATALASSGQATTATVVQASSVFVFDLVLRLTEGVLLPAVCTYFCVLTVDAALEDGRLDGLAQGIHSLTASVLKWTLTLFTAYLTIAGGVSGSVDRAALKAARFAVSGAVPVVGGVLSDATETMLSGAGLLRGSLGVFGMLCVTAICFLPFVRIGAGYLCYRMGAALLSPLCTGKLGKLLGGMGAGFGLLLGMLSTGCMILYLELVYVVAMVKPG